MDHGYYLEIWGKIDSGMSVSKDEELAKCLGQVALLDSAKEMAVFKDGGLAKCSTQLALVASTKPTTDRGYYWRFEGRMTVAWAYLMMKDWRNSEERWHCWIRPKSSWTSTICPCHCVIRSEQAEISDTSSSDDTAHATLAAATVHKESIVEHGLYTADNFLLVEYIN